MTTRVDVAAVFGSEEKARERIEWAKRYYASMLDIALADLAAEALDLRSELAALRKEREVAVRAALTSTPPAAELRANKDAAEDFARYPVPSHRCHVMVSHPDTGVPGPCYAMHPCGRHYGQPSECRKGLVSSRTCERGTQSCEVVHDEVKPRGSYRCLALPGQCTSVASFDGAECKRCGWSTMRVPSPSQPPPLTGPNFLDQEEWGHVRKQPTLDEIPLRAYLSQIEREESGKTFVTVAEKALAACCRALMREKS
jgi:hypothetical protein